MKASKPIDYSLYLVTDRKLLKGNNLLGSIEEAITGGVTIIQLREKDCCTRDFFDVALKVKTITDSHNIPLIINDRLDIALAVNAAGLHIGQDDMPAKIARKLLGPAKILGVSASTLEEAITAQIDGADYCGVGAIFPTGSKHDARQVPLETLRQIKARLTIPIVAIGGINQNNARTVLQEKVDGIAVISAILCEQDCRKAAENLGKIVRSEIREKCV